MNSLIDTNIFLEILLEQKRKRECESLLESKTGLLYISDFSLHSIGVILFRKGKIDDFAKFVDDIFKYFKIVSLSKKNYKTLIEISESCGLDFDDAYQSAISKEFDLCVITMDKDFERAKGKFQIEFI